jgi:hypothetical protein
VATHDQLTLLFTEDFDERMAFDIEQKGWCGIALVQLPNGARFKLFFYDPVRLAQDLENGLARGAVCIAEPGLVVVPRVTREYMQKAVNQLFENGYFNNVAP